MLRELVLASVACLTVVALSGCSGSISQALERTGQVVPSGSRLILHQNLEVRPGRDRVSIQGGKVFKFGSPSLGKPLCRLIIDDFDQTSRTIAPGEFLVKRVSFYNEDWTYTTGLRLQLATLYLSGGTSGGPTWMVYWTIMHLRSASQPRVKTLRCGELNDPTIARPLTVEQVRATLGNLATLETP
jgi:hypothetical protein